MMVRCVNLSWLKWMKVFGRRAGGRFWGGRAGHPVQNDGLAHCSGISSVSGFGFDGFYAIDGSWGL